MGIQEVKWVNGGTVRAAVYILFYGRGKENHQLGTRFFVQHRIISVVKRVEFVRDRKSYIVLRRFWYNIILFNELASSEEKTDDSRDGS